MMIVLFTLFMVVYGGINGYVGLRAWQWLQVVVPLQVPSGVYWVGFWLVAGAPIVARIIAGRAPRALTGVLSQIGDYWFAVFFYALLLLVTMDLLRLGLRLSGIMTVGQLDARLFVGATGAAIALVLVGVLAYGSWRARTPVVTDYEITIDKPAGRHRQLTAVLISDTHLGYTNGIARVRELVGLANGLKPDLVLITGDLLDDDLQPFLAADMASELGQLEAPLGVYAIMGNHDVRTGELPIFRAEMERAGIRLLVDERIIVDNSLVLVGRNDNSPPRSSGDVAPLSELVAGVDSALPLLIMDHNPIRAADSVAVGADLQVSGHTHAGQIFPFNLVTQRVYEKDWGYLQQGDTHVVISSGFGTWGPPIRVGTRSEIVRIAMTFAP